MSTIERILFTASLVILLLAVIGEGLCVYKAVSCNWEPVGKAEAVYTGAALCGAGCIIGYLDIEDN